MSGQNWTGISDCKGRDHWGHLAGTGHAPIHLPQTLDFTPESLHVALPANLLYEALAQLIPLEGLYCAVF